MNSLNVFPNAAINSNKNFYKDDTRLDGWNPGEQHAAFIQMMQIEDFVGKPFKEKSILDVGCGTGELSRYLGRSEIASYTGVDIMAKAVMDAKRKYPPSLYPNRSFMKKDILKVENPRQYDFVFASGALSINLSPIGIDNYDFAEGMIKKMLQMTKYGMVFNVLSDAVANPGQELFFYSLIRLKRLCERISDVKMKIHKSEHEKLHRHSLEHLYFYFKKT